MKTLIIYNSQTGFTARYAQWMAEATGADRMELKEAKNAIKVLGGKAEKTISYNLPTGDERTLILIKKVQPTPEKYPRNKGQMMKKKL